jgi:hypothetical protein
MNPTRLGLLVILIENNDGPLGHTLGQAGLLGWKRKGMTNSMKWGLKVALDFGPKQAW